MNDLNSVMDDILASPDWETSKTDPVKLARGREQAFGHALSQLPDLAKTYEGFDDKQKGESYEYFTASLAKKRPELFEVEVTPEKKAMYGGGGGGGGAGGAVKRVVRPLYNKEMEAHIQAFREGKWKPTFSASDPNAMLQMGAILGEAVPERAKELKAMMAPVARETLVNRDLRIPLTRNDGMIEAAHMGAVEGGLELGRSLIEAMENVKEFIAPTLKTGSEAEQKADAETEAIKAQNQALMATQDDGLGASETIGKLLPLVLGESAVGAVTGLGTRGHLVRRLAEHALQTGVVTAALSPEGKPDPILMILGGVGGLTAAGLEKLGIGGFKAAVASVGSQAAAAGVLAGGFDAPLAMTGDDHSDPWRASLENGLMAAVWSAVHLKQVNQQATEFRGRFPGKFTPETPDHVVVETVQAALAQPAAAKPTETPAAVPEPARQTTSEPNRYDLDEPVAAEAAASAETSQPRQSATPSTPTARVETKPETGAAARDAEPSTKKTTALFEDWVNLDRANRGEKPVGKDGIVTREEAMRAGQAALAANPDAATEVMATAREAGPLDRKISRLDLAVLAARKIGVENERNAAAERLLNPDTDPSTRAAAKQTWDAKEKEIAELDQAAQDVRGVWGGFGQFLGQIFKMDYSFEGLRRKTEVQRGEKLDPTNPEHKAELDGLRETANAHAATEKAKEEATAQKEAQERERYGAEWLAAELESSGRTEAAKAARESLGEEMTPPAEPTTPATEPTATPAKPKKPAAAPKDYVPKNPTALGKLETVLAKMEADVDARIEQRRKARQDSEGSGESRLQSIGFDANALADLAIKGTVKLARMGVKGAAKFGEWSGQMKAEHGDEVTPHLSNLWAQSKARVAEMEKTVPRDIDAERTSTVVGMKAKVAEAQANGQAPNFADLSRYANTLAKQFIEQGIHKIEPLTDAVHGEMQKVFPEISRTEARDAFTGYGKWKPATTDPVGVLKAQLKGAGREVSKIEGLPKLAKATGVGRPPTGAEERLLKKEYNAKKRILERTGAIVMDNAARLKSTFETDRTRRQNEIDDLDYAIASGKKFATREKSKLTDDQQREINDLVLKRAELKKQYDAIFPKEPITPEEQLRRATEIAQKNADAWAKKVTDAKAGKYPGKEKGVKITAPEIERLRAEAKASQAEVAHLKDMDAALKDRALDAQLERSLAELESGLTKQVRAPTNGPDTAYQAGLKSRIAELQKIRAEAKKGPVTPEHIKRLEAIRERIEARKDQIASGDTSVKGRKPTVETEANTAALADLKALDDILAAMRKSKKPVTPEHLKRLESLRDRIAERKDKLARGDTSTGARSTVETAENAAALAELKVINDAIAEMRRGPATPAHIKQLEKIRERLAVQREKLAKGDTSTAGRTQNVDPAANAYYKAELTAVNHALALMRQAAKPRKSAVEIALGAKLAGSLRRAADLKLRMALLDFGPRAKKTAPIPVTKAEKAIQAKLEQAEIAQKQVEREFGERQAKWERDQRNAMTVLWHGMKHTWKAVPNLASSFDFSGFRQAAGAVAANVGKVAVPVNIGYNPAGNLRIKVMNPARIGKELLLNPTGRMFKAWWKESKAVDLEHRRQKKMASGAYVDIQFTDLNATTFSKTEEMQRSILDEWAKVPFKTGNPVLSGVTFAPKVVAKGVRMSNRAFITLLNESKMALADHLHQINFQDRPPTVPELKVLAEFVNVSHGRGIRNQKVAEAGSWFLWSASLAASRLKGLTLQPIWSRPSTWKGTGRARAIVAQEYARVIMTA